MRARPLSVAALLLVLAGCSGGPAASEPTSPIGTPGPSGSIVATDCPAAPAPPAQVPGWSSAATEPTVFPVIVNSSGSLTCGGNRLLFTFLDGDNRPVGSPDRTATVSLFSLGRDPAAAVGTAAGTFTWGIENERGFYTAPVTFPESGEWGAEFTTAVAGGSPETIRMRFEVAPSSPVVRVGDPAPASDTPTAASVKGDLARLSTDPKPDPALYEQSVKGALAAHEPFVLIFATPKFCASAQCGPTLDRVKPLVGEFPSVRFIHVEPYELTFLDGGLQPVQDAGGALIPAQSVFDWGLLSEPWVFVVDRDGIVTASFEGVVGAEELLAAVNAVK